MSLVSCDVGTYNELDPERGRAIAIVEPAEQAKKVLAALPALERYMHQHPVLSHHLANPNSGPSKITDFLTRRQFERLELYQQVFVPSGVRYQLVTPLRTPLPLAIGVYSL